LALVFIVSSSIYSQTAGSSPAAPQGQARELRAAAIVGPPFVMEQDGSLTGFSIELWNAIAARLKLKSSCQIMPDGKALEDAMRSKRADIVVSPVMITSARDEIFDFSHPIIQAGLQVMVRDTGQDTQTVDPLWDVLAIMFSRTTAVWLGVALLLVLIPAHLIWWFERRQEDGMISSRRYFPGIFEAIYWALSTLTTQAEAMPRQWVGRTLSIFWMFAGVVFVAFYTAQLTTTLTVQQIRGAIEGPGDLPGKQVATLTNSTAVDYLRAHNAQVQEFPTTDQMFKALQDKKVDAVVSVSPILLYYAAHGGKGLVKVVGSQFNTAPFAFMVQEGSLLRPKINVALSSLRENDTYQQLYDKWFGGP
jgi:polar amino acid transport system substrate-binding protein